MLPLNPQYLLHPQEGTRAIICLSKVFSLLFVGQLAIQVGVQIDKQIVKTLLSLTSKDSLFLMHPIS